MIKYFFFNNFTLEEINNLANNNSKEKFAFFISLKELNEYLDYIIESKFDYIVYEKDNKNDKIAKIKNKYESKKNRRLLTINSILKIKNINQFDIYTNFEYNNHNDGIYKSSNYVNHKFCQMLKDKNKFYLIDIDLLNQALKQNDSRIILRIKETIKNLYKNRINFIITDTSKRNYSINNYIDLLFYLGLKDKKYSKKILEHDFFVLEKILKL